MTLRSVAAERLGKCRRASTREPTGSVESTYSRMTAMTTSRCRPSTVRKLYQLHEERVREEEPGFGQPHAVARVGQQGSRAPLVEEPAQARVPVEARLEQGCRDAVGGAQTEDQPLGQALPLGQELGRRDREAGPGERLAVARGGLDVRVAQPADEPAGAGSGGEVFGRVPVDLVVARAKAGPRVVRDLVVLQAARRRGARQAPVLLDLRVLRRDAVDAGGAPEAAGIQGQAVSREVIRAPVEHALDGARPAVRVEPGQAVHQIDAQVDAAGGASGLEGRTGAARVVEPSEPREDRVVERLHAEAQPVDAGSTVTGELVSRDALGIALDRDLGAGGDVESGANPIEHRGHVLDAEQ